MVGDSMPAVASPLFLKAVRRACASGLVASDDALHLRLLCCSGLEVVGRLEYHDHSCEEPVIFSAEASGEAIYDITPAPLRKKHSVGGSSGDDDDDEEVDLELRPVACLTRTMRRCFIALKRLRREIQLTDRQQEEATFVQSIFEQIEAELSELDQMLERVGVDMLCGRIRSVGSFGERTRAALAKTLFSFPLLALPVDNFESEFLLAEVPEVDCFSIPLEEMHDTVLYIDVGLSVELRSISVTGAAHFNPRWLWAEVACVDADGIELDFVRRVRIDGAVSPSVGPSEAPLRFNGDLDKVRSVSSDPCVRFERRLHCIPSEKPAGKFLHLIERSAQEIRLSLRADWLVLQTCQLRIHAQRIVIATLRANGCTSD